MNDNPERPVKKIGAAAHFSVSTFDPQQGFKKLGFTDSTYAHWRPSKTGPIGKPYISFMSRGKCSGCSKPWTRRHILWPVRELYQPKPEAFTVLIDEAIEWERKQAELRDKKSSSDGESGDAANRE